MPTTHTSHDSHDDADAAPDDHAAEHGHEREPGAPVRTVEVQLPEPMAVGPDHAAFGNCEAIREVDGDWYLEVDLYDSCRLELTVSEARRAAAELLAVARWVEQRNGAEPFLEVDTDGAGSR